MLETILAIKFVHMIAMAVMFGTWLTLALFMVFAFRSRNTPVVALTLLFVVRAELGLMIPAIALQPLAGIPLAVAIGAPATELWLEISLVLYAAVVVVWLANFIIEWRMRKLTHQAAVESVPLPETYRRLFAIWSVLALLGLCGMCTIMALMVFQPHWA